MKTPHAALSEIARGLISASAQFEPASTGARARALDGLALLSSLEQITRGSLPSSAPAAPAVATAENRAPAARPAPPSVTTARKEYRPALGDRAIVEALLHLQSRVQKTRPAAGPPPSFQPLEAPKVEAEPASFRYARRSPGVYHPILRSPSSSRST